MSIKILTNRNVEITHIDDARNYNFNAGLRSGIVEGAFNEGTLFNAYANSIALDTCELRVYGFRIIVDEVWNKPFIDKPTTNIRYKLVGTLNVDENATPTFDLNIYAVDTILKEDKLFKNKNATGTYQVEIGRFTLNTNGEVVDIVRTIDVITGGTGKGGSGAINIGNVTTQTLDAGTEAEVDIEERYVEEENKTYTDFNFSIPQGVQGKQGIQGETGLPAVTSSELLYSGSAPSLYGNLYADPFLLSRTPKKDELCLFMWRQYNHISGYKEKDATYLVIGKFTGNVNNDKFVFTIEQFMETTGLQALVFKNILETTSYPLVDIIRTAQVEDFNRTPVVNDTFYLIAYNTAEKVSYLCLCDVSSVTDVDVKYYIVNVQRLTGEQGPQGKAGATFTYDETTRTLTINTTE